MKKGFTLIELLAVIVILAIIALIATPIVLSIIEDTKESAVLRSAEYYLSAVEQSIMKKNLTAGGSFSPNTCEVQSDGNLLCDNTEALELEVNGEVPSSGTITFEKGKIVDVELTLGNKTVSKDEEGKLVLGELQEKSICALVEGEANTIGSKYQCKVKDDMETGWEDGYYFYVLSSEEDGTTNLIMDRNVYYDDTDDIGMVATETNKGLVAWYENDYHNPYGPVTAMTYLHNATKDWTNVPNMIMNYEDENALIDSEYGYGSIVTTETTTIITSKTDEETGRLENLKARMPKYSELTGEEKCTTSSGSCPLWLSNYLNSSSYVTGEGLQNISGIYGYWLLSSYGSPSSPGARGVDYYGDVENYDSISDSNRFGVRPVINIKL